MASAKKSPICTAIAAGDSPPALRAVRDAHGIPRIRIAVEAGVCEPTVRNFENCPASVKPETRARLMPVYQRLERELAG